ncbi:MAG TPA: hypothetical protein VJB92_02115 [Candidatus Paceibacterota bacterium]
MDLDRNSWHVRLFFWSQGICDNFTDWDKACEYKKHTNLCHYVRVICVYMPFVILFHLTGYGAAIIALTYLPFRLFGTGYWYVLGSIAALASITYAILLTSRYFANRPEKEPEIEETQKALEPIAEQPKKSPGFFEVIFAYLAAAKKRICPVVNFYTQRRGSQ